jgi:NADPH2:quinone reductase
MFVSFGNSSGPAPEFSPMLLSQKGSLFFTRPTLFHYARTPELLQETADDLFAAMASGAVKIAPPTRYRLSEAAQAHRDLEARRTTGSVVLTP